MIVIVSNHAYKYGIFPNYLAKAVECYSWLLSVPLMSDRIGNLTLDLKILRI